MIYVYVYAWICIHPPDNVDGYFPNLPKLDEMRNSIQIEFVVTLVMKSHYDFLV